MAGKDKPISWKKLLYDFSQSTTFHGVRYITGDTPFIARRLIWFILVLFASSVFIWFMTLRLQYLQSNPKAVDVEVIYTDSVTFPAVTICNQNLFRASSTLQLGLHDIVEDSFRDLQSEELAPGEEEDTSTHGFEVYHDTDMKGIGRPHVTYMGITAQVCRHLCVKMHSDSCCSVLYERGSKTCKITPLEVNSAQVSLVSLDYTDYYRRKKCQVQKSANCSFEEDTCMFVVDTNKKALWNIVDKHEKKVDVERPEFDHTTMTANGKYLLAFTKFPQPNSVAHLISPYILSEENTCIHFYYQLGGGTLNIKLRMQQDKDTVIWSRVGGSTLEWEKAHQKLPSGYYRVVIESLSHSGTERLNVALDDLHIDTCEISNNCKETMRGRGYAGSLSKTRSGHTCSSWESVPTYLLDYLWLSSDPKVIDKRALRNYCRNPDDDVRGPWCYTDVESGQTENCEIPACECRDVEFACDNGRCVSTDVLCNKVDDCGDNSDEVIPCNRTETIECDFDEGWMCGYKTHQSSTLDWRMKTTGDGFHIGVDTTKFRKGDVAVLVSPPVELQGVRCLHMDYYIAGQVQLDIFTTNTNRRFLKQRLCSIEFDKEDQGWNSTDIMLPPGEYRLQFEAAMEETAKARMYLDNITLYNENCTTTELIGTTEETPTTIMTTDQMTTNENVTASEYDVTTPGVNATVSYYYEYVHEPFEHWQCSANTAQCKTCAQAFSDIKSCGPKVKQLYNETDGVSVKCDHLGNKHKVVLESCITETLALGGNFFNFRRGSCYVKKCESSSVDEVQLTEKHGGSDVFALIEPAEGIDVVSFSCQFLDECACGYQFLSSNMFDRWQRVEPEKEVEEAGNATTAAPIEDEDEYFLTLTNKYGHKPRNGDWSRLISPEREVRETSCLKFNYYTQLINIQLYKDAGDDWSPLIKIMHDGQLPVWHTASVTIPPGKYRLVFNLDFGEQFNEKMAGIDNINVTEESCSGQMKNEEGPFNCSFDSDDLCGYHDASNGSVKFIRSKSFGNKSPGGFYMRSSNYLEGKGSTVFKSPFYTYSNISCLQFFYFLQSADKGHLSTMALSAEFPAGNRTVIWRLRGITDNQWHFAQTEIYYGYFRLVFEINGDKMRGGLDDIVVLDGVCPERNCTEEEEEYMCVSNFACIPHSNVCDGVPNCALGEDESDPTCGGHNETLPEDEEEQIKQVDHADIDAKNTGVEVNLTDIYMRGGHQGGDLIYRCGWEGEPCHHSNFTKEVTDYGLCYTFNSGDEPLRTDQTGSRFGLSLTLNIEQYEYMRGPQSDAGIKVFLHSKDELPQVRDLGFAISPGTHALVGIRLNEAENLPPPWGDCATRDLLYYDTYVHSRCLRECETKQIVAACGCRDAYMPGKSADNPPVCNLTRYFTCAIPTINSVISSDIDCVTECPKPCQQTVYEPALSQAALSVLSVDKILSKNINQLAKKYHDALEAQQRVKEDVFLDDLQMIDDVHRQYIYLREFAKKYLGDFEKSLFAKIWTASSTLVVGIFESDVNTLFRSLQDHIDAYSLFFEDASNLLSIYITELDTGFHELAQLLQIGTDEPNNNRFLVDILERVDMKVTLASQNLRLFQRKMADRDLLRTGDKDNDKLIESLPKRFATKNNNCDQDLATLVTYLDDLKKDMKQIHSGNGTMNSTFVGNQIRERIPWFLKKSSHLQRCLKEYQQSLVKTEEWLDSALKMVEDYRDQKPFSGESFNFTAESGPLEQDEKEVAKIYQKYSFDQISKLNYLRHFDPDEQSSDVSINIRHFVDQIQNRLTVPLRERVQKIRRDLQKEYQNCFEIASKLQRYLPDKSFYTAANGIKIWKVPSPNLENPDKCPDTGREYWKVWNRDMDIETFTKKELPKVVGEGLDSFCNQLLNILDGFDQQLVLHKQKLLTALERIQKAYDQYKDLRLIEHQFVLKNFLNVDVYFAQLKHQNVKQIEAYQVTQFLGDVGGFMGLLLGGSVLTVFELIDLIVFNFVKKLLRHPAPGAVQRDDDTTDSEASTKSKNANQIYSNKMAPFAVPEMFDPLTKA